jgi:hypothetical protein
MNEEDIPELTEAVRRLPEEEQNLRMFRMKRALDLSMKHQLLPKEEWTKPEEVMGHSRKHSYLLHIGNRPFPF